VSAGFALVERIPIPRYLRNGRTGPVSVRQYEVGTWRRWKDAAQRLCVCFSKVSLCFAIAGLIILVLGHSYYDHRAAQENLASLGNLPERIELVDADGRFFTALAKPSTRRSIRSLDELPQPLVAALLTMEDRRFFEHGGVNWNGVVRAAAHDAKTLSLKQGGSGITQQLAKLWKFGVIKAETAGQKFDRKFLEWHLARRIEANYTKQEILCHYLNRIDFGGGFHGLYAAAEGFFAKAPKDLTISETATLVAILRGPGEYSPIKHPNRTRARRNLVLRQLSKAHPEMLPSGQMAKVCEEPIILRNEAWQKTNIASAISLLVEKELVNAVSPAVLARGGLRVILTIDSTWNDAVAESVEGHLRSIEARRGPSRAPLQAAAVVLDTRTGAVRVMIPGRPSVGGQLNRATQSYREPGSAIKPFAYALFFELGAKLDDTIDAGPIRPGELSIGPANYCPRNAGRPYGMVTLQEALEKSINTAAVRVGDKLGIEVFAAALDRIGVAKNRAIPRSPTAYLGTMGVRPVDLAASYTIFANHGIQCPEPHIVQTVIDSGGTTIFSSTGTGDLRLSPRAADQTAECLRGVMTRGTARAAAKLGLREPALGKTGTTNDVKDAWFAGATADVTCVVWVGFDKPTPILDAYAAQLSLPLWVRILNVRPAKKESGSIAAQKP
jgi:penicillin-binding protein 1A